MSMRNVSPHPEKVPYPIIRPRPGQPVRCVCLTKTIFGVDTHFGNGQTYYCPGPEDCEACKGGGVARYQGYVMGLGFQSNVTAIVHLTANAAEMLEKLERPGRGLLGLKMSLFRTGKTDNGEVEAQAFGWEDHVAEFSRNRLSELMHSVYRVKGLQAKERKQSS
ncbi:unnamed protein product [marine sediment metagenome]|uniref:Uncharacterized protein n=1 Tax=marine sediment metagenome TaxID=412755 RepID=X1LD90_9ZZZZ